MTNRRLSAFIDALVSGRRPGRFSAGPDDVEVLRTAIALRAARPGDAKPDEEFVSGLYEELATQARPQLGRNVRPVKFSRGRAALVAAAASVVLVAGTATATEAFTRGRAAPVAVPAPHGQVLRTATFETPDHQAVGQIVAYRGNRGNPSWVFMNVDVAHYDGRIVCMLRNNSGSTVAAGTFELHDGVGQFSRTLRVDFGRLRGARLATPGGSLVGTATFA
jgi:hypothetical protein